ncbi:porphobilinogen synthase [Pelagibacteraceae bacterium]|jgi:porphobilinogen synthase|nr:porphobilinogen synthase [Pelagibacteraceae bacterium]
MKNIGTYPSLRMRRNRKADWIRRLVSEHNLSANDLILPLFVTEGTKKKESIDSMPNVFRYTIDELARVVEKACKLQIPLIALFPHSSPKKKDAKGKEALNKNNLICKTLRYLKKEFKNDIGIMCDVALDPYTTHGHDGILKNNKVDNDKTIEILIKQSLLQAEMKCDIIAPSDMMDGRIGKIRNALDKKGFNETQIVSYAIKYASSFYGPFRDAVGSKKNLKGDKKTYQMDFRNAAEALREVALDVGEGADIVMVKPGMPYLDIIKSVKENFKIPVFSYQVSGEYSLIKNGIKKGIINEEAILESLVSLKRAGSNAIVSYFSLEVADQLK